MRKYLALATLMLAVGSAIFMLRGKPHDDKMAQPTLEHHSEPSLTVTELSAPAYTIASDEQKPVSSRDTKVAERLERFQQKTAGITEASIAEEREEIARGLRQALGKKAELPNVSIDVDDDGEVWQELDYGNGIVRYLPAQQDADTL